ncbi:MAG: hypothetical protein IPM82_26520 [Saprospiraceae bacterium]|nr:hypothetical protein [Saprospiraceae bacterium]
MVSRERVIEPGDPYPSKRYRTSGFNNQRSRKSCLIHSRPTCTMIEQKLLEYYQSLGKEFHLLLEALLSQKSGKQLHPLRVNLKKQLALFDLLAILEEGFALKTVRKPAKKIMKAISALRDAQVGAQIANIFEQRLFAYSPVLEAHQGGAKIPVKVIVEGLQKNLPFAGASSRRGGR